jgi:hypothetical protein
MRGALWQPFVSEDGIRTSNPVLPISKQPYFWSQCGRAARNIVKSAIRSRC